MDYLYPILYISLLLAFPAGLAYAIFSDLNSLTIPNWVSVTLGILFLPLALLEGFSWDVIGAHYGAGFLLFFLGAILFSRNLLGGGDVKLLCAATIWVGWNNLMIYLLIVAVIGGLQSLLVILIRKFPIAPYFGRLPFLERILSRDQVIPYGVAIGLGGVLVFPRLEIAASFAGLAGL